MPGVFDVLEASLVAVPRQLPEKPKALLVVTAHWEERELTASGSKAPPMIYDYGGFPPHTYHVKYPAPGSPELAERVVELLAKAGIPGRVDAERGFDHGTFTPLQPMYPKADMPVVQLSILKKFDPMAHVEAGRALAPLRDEGILILGSGLSYHNLGQMGPKAAVPSKAFDAWLQETVLRSSPEERVARLKGWSKAPSARLAHPREDHLLPLMVAVGAAEAEKAALVYHEEAFMGGWCVSSFRFG